MKQDLFDWEAAEEPISKPAPKVPTYRECLVEQIIRDRKVLEEDPIYHQPSTQFYLDRIVAYMLELKKIDAEEAKAQHPDPSGV